MSDLPDGLSEFITVHKHHVEPRRPASAPDKRNPGVPLAESIRRAKKASRAAKAAPPRGEDDERPTVKLIAGRIKGSVDAVESALIARGGLYQRANSIVFVGEAPMKTHGDREVTTTRIFERGENALAEDVAEAVYLTRFDARAGCDVPVNSPSWLIRTLQQRTGRFRFPLLVGVVNAPTLRPDGTLLDRPGYDRATGLIYDPRGVTFPKILVRPSRRDAERALATLSALIAGFPFEGPESKAVALSAILTACVRQALPTAPLHAFTAPAAGTGKTKIVDIASVISSGREAGVISQSPIEEEMEKRLSAMLLQGASAIAIDNCTAPLNGNFLCIALTQPTSLVRPLGTSKQVEVNTNAFVSATGNNLVIAGDMTRRAIVSRLDAKMERPELREFSFEPVERAKGDRPRYVAAALTILLAYTAAGAPRQSSPLGSFEEWSRLVRDALIWLGCGDPCATMEQARATDPTKQELREVMTYWAAALGTDRTTVRRLIDRANRQSSAALPGGRADYDYPDLREALLAVAGQGGAINGKRLGRWLLAHSKQPVGTCIIEQDGEVSGSAVWRLVDMSGKKSGLSQLADSATPEDLGL